MNNKDIVRNILETVLEVEIEKENNFNRDECSKWDSLKHVEVIFALEEEFKIRFEEDEFMSLKSLDDIVNIIESHEPQL